MWQSTQERLPCALAWKLAPFSSWQLKQSALFEELAARTLRATASQRLTSALQFIRTSLLACSASCGTLWCGNHPEFSQNLRVFFADCQKVMAGGAIIGYYAPVGACMIAVVTPETAREISMSHVVRVGAP